MRSNRTLKGVMMNSTSSKHNNSRYGRYNSIYKRKMGDYTCISIVYLLVLLYLAMILIYSLMVKMINFDKFPIF